MRSKVVESPAGHYRTTKYENVFKSGLNKGTRPRYGRQVLISGTRRGRDPQGQAQYNPPFSDL